MSNKNPGIKVRHWINRVLLVGLFISVTGFGAEGPAKDSEESGVPGLESSVERLMQYRRNLHRWDRMVRGFRRDHSFTMSGGPTSAIWTIEDLYGRKDAESKGSYANFQYTFHLPLYRSFGYYLGSGFGGVFSEEAEKGDFAVFRSISLPGVQVGLVLNITPAFRATVGIDGYMQRIERLRVRNDLGENESISITTRNLATQVAAEVFFDLRWALRFEWMKSSVFYGPPLNLNSNSVLATDLQKQETRIGAGLVYHLI